MIDKLVELAERQRKQNSNTNIRQSHDALKTEMVAIDCVIDSGGQFVEFVHFDKVETLAEALSSKKGKARLLVDKIIKSDSDKLICESNSLFRSLGLNFSISIA